MKIKFSFLTVLLIVLCTASATFAQDGQITGGYGDASVTDKDVIKAAKFAVKRRSQTQNVIITLRSISKAQLQVVSGINYKLCLEVNYKRRSDRKSVKRFVQTVVYRNLRNIHSLTSWKMTVAPPDCE